MLLAMTVCSDHISRLNAIYTPFSLHTFFSLFSIFVFFHYIYIYLFSSLKPVLKHHCFASGKLHILALSRVLQALTF